MAVILGTTRNDRVTGSEAADVVTGLAGDDRIVGMAGADAIQAGAGDDVVYTGSRTHWSDGAVDTVLAGVGDDRVFGAYGDLLNGGAGFDRLSLDLSGADGGVAVNFRPMTLAKVGDPVTVKIDGTELSGFEAVTEVIGTRFADRVVMDNRAHVGAVVDLGRGDDSVRANHGDDQLSGGRGDDRMVGLSGRDLLSGGAGDDRLIGGRSQDVLTGGAGADRFFFDDSDTSRARSHADTITDFNHAAGDRISLGGIDAVAGGDDDRFTFIGAHRFSGSAGELRSAFVGDHTFVFGDTDGDGHADVAIRLDGHVALVAADFRL